MLPEKAVTWTQPIDWDVDLEDPKQGILDEEHEMTSVAFADGSVHFFGLETLNEQLRALLTKDGSD